MLIQKEDTNEDTKGRGGKAHQKERKHKGTEKEQKLKPKIKKNVKCGDSMGEEGES